jgi:hypothetical protein
VGNLFCYHLCEHCNLTEINRMARKKQVKPVPATTSEVKAVRLELDPKTHQELRVVAAQHGKSMASYVRELVEQELAKHRGIKK